MSNISLSLQDKVDKLFNKVTIVSQSLDKQT